MTQEYPVSELDLLRFGPRHANLGSKPCHRSLPAEKLNAYGFQEAYFIIRGFNERLQLATP